MRCLQCGKKLSLLRKIAKGAFCSAEHRDLYQSDVSQLALARLHESQVRIERPSGAAAKAALAAVERLRAMDSSAADPEFFETFQFAEIVNPQNYRRLAWPCVEPLVAGWNGELPDRGNRRKPLSMAAPGGLFGVVEPSPIIAAGRPRILASRPQFRLGVRLLTTATGPKAGQMRQVGLSSLPMPVPILRPSRMEAGQFEKGSGAVPDGRSPGLPGIARPAVGDSPEKSLRPGGLVDVDAILPGPAKFGPEAVHVHLAANPLTAELPAPMDLALRAAGHAVPIIDVRSYIEPAEQPSSEPLAVEMMEPVILSVATVSATLAQGSITALAEEFSPSLPGLPGFPAAERMLSASDELEALELRSACGTTTTCGEVQPIVGAGGEAAPALQCRPESRMRPDERLLSVDTQPAAGVRSIREIVAAVTAGEMTSALPRASGIRCEAAGMRQDSDLMAVGLLSADPRSLVMLSMAVELENGLGASVPSHDGVHTTLPKMREATDLQGLAVGVALRSDSAPATACAEAQPLSMTAAAGVSGPAVPGFTAHPEPLAKPAASAKVQEPEVVQVVREPAPPAEDAGPPAILRQLPLALGRARGGRVDGFRTQEDHLSSSWQTAIEAVPFSPSLSLKIDHADGSGSRQGGKGSTADRRPLLPPIDLRSLPGRKFWRYAPADLKWAALGLPLILVFVVYSFRGSPSKAESIPAAAPQTASAPAEVSRPASGSPAPAPAPTEASTAPTTTPVSFTNSLKQVLVSRAAVNLLDDFRGGLSAWQGEEGWAKTWHYGQATFLEPGNLAFYKPSMGLRDYSLEFLGQIQGRSLNWVFRAKDSKNYYAMRIVVTGGGPMPDAQIVQYAVINGKEERRKVLPTPYPIRPNTMYLVRVEVHGSDFNIYVQGQPMYNFTDERLAQGGVGFFSPKGDKSFLRWVQVKHQYDYIGRLCAMLAPYQVPPEAAKTE